MWSLLPLLLYLLMLLPLGILCSAASAEILLWNGTFSPEKILVQEEQRVNVTFVPGLASLKSNIDKIEVLTAEHQIAEVTSDTALLNISNLKSNENITFGITGRFLGITTVQLRASDAKNQTVAETAPAEVRVVRVKSILDDIFIGCVSTLLALNYINMGCSLDMSVVKQILRRPKAPAIGLVSQYIFMPLISFGLSYAIFATPNMRLGLFTVGCSPGGGASNMWTYLLGGNLNLSITMTFLSNVLAFVTMPLWLFTLGRVIFKSSNIEIPYRNIMTMLVVLVIPIGIGLLMQRYLPRVAKMCRKILGPFGGFMIAFIVIFGVIANLYMFYLFDWRVVLGGIGVPWLGYAFGAFLGRISGFSFEDIVAISVETGVQNSGIAIVLLRFSLPQPDADLTSVIPVAASIMMPLPLLCLLVLFRLMGKRKAANNYEVCQDIVKSESDSIRDNSKLEFGSTDDKNNTKY